MPDRVISVPQAAQIAQRIKNKFDNVNGRLQQLDSTVNGETSVNYTEGKNLSASSTAHTIVDNENTSISDFIPVTESESVRFTYTDDATDATVYQLWVYDSGKEFIGYYGRLATGTNNRSITPKTGSAYARFSFKRGFAATLTNSASTVTYYEAGQTETNGLVEKVGNLSNLETESKSDLVSAVNEVSEKVDTAATELKNEIAVVENEVFEETELTASATGANYKLKDDGLSIRDTSYQLVKYTVSEGDSFKVISDHKFQFQSVANVPSSGTGNRVGETYGVGTFFVKAPVGATYLIVSTTVQNSTATVYSAVPRVNTVETPPAYYHANDYLSTKVSRINELGKTADDVFIFITDVHWERNAKQSPALINYLMKNCNISKVFNGGDLADGINTKAVDAFKNATIGEIHHVTGNHEWFPPETGKSLYYALDYDKNDQIGEFADHYWYFDNVQSKIRYVVLNGYKHSGSDLTTGWEYGFSAEQIAWFRDTALDVPNGYDVIIITHYFGTNSSKQTGATDIENAITTFNASDRTGKVLFIVEGHRHWDAVFTTGMVVPVVLTTCDKYDVSNESTLAGYVRERGTLTEQAFDVCVINRDTQTATFVRIGAKALDNTNVSIGESSFTFAETLDERAISFA